MDGFYLVDKETDWTSFDVCARMRKLLNIKKVGHTGTLDPFATGLLLIATGKCTKLIPFFEKEHKTYVTTILLGKDSPTLDTESEMEDVKIEKEPTLKEVEQKMCSSFQGIIQQTPPQFSAIKIAGKKACDVARRGEKVDLKPRETEVVSSKIVSYRFPEIEIEMTVKAGFYVRAFARDLGASLGTKAICTQLRRTYIGDLSVDDAEKIDHISASIDPKFVLTQIDHREIPMGRVQDFIAGRSFDFPAVDKEKILVLVGGKSMGIGEMVHGKLQPRVVL
jgi:tRNA pseudouridine55 synthase